MMTSHLKLSKGPHFHLPSQQGGRLEFDVDFARANFGRA